jgi:alkyl sulfatase BDS1-like metallo-beta-lactamase superfamily hydrolase
VELSNATLTNIAGYQVDDADLTLTVNCSDLEKIMAGEPTFEAPLTDGRAQAAGDVDVLKQLAALMVDFNPSFEIMPGTKCRTEVPHAEPYEAVPRKTIAEW